MRKTILAICLAGWTAGCATADGLGGAERPPGLFAARGQAVAEQQCSTCHAIDGITSSARPAAPPFRELRVRFNTLTFERAMKEIGEGGHDEMPPLRLDESDVRDLRAFIESVK